MRFDRDQYVAPSTLAISVPITEQLIVDIVKKFFVALDIPEFREAVLDKINSSSNSKINVSSAQNALAASIVDTFITDSTNNDQENNPVSIIPSISERFKFEPAPPVDVNTLEGGGVPKIKI